MKMGFVEQYSLVIWKAYYGENILEPHEWKRLNLLIFHEDTRTLRHLFIWTEIE